MMYESTSGISAEYTSPAHANGPMWEGSMRSTRAEMLRRGGRELDMSHLLAAGNLVIVAEADGAPLPYPMEVEGERMGGDGRVVYQATLPLRNRTRLSRPAPAEPEPAATAPAAAPVETPQSQ